jgi:hypothetical protein
MAAGPESLDVRDHLTEGMSMLLGIRVEIVPVEPELARPVQGELYDNRNGKELYQKSAGLNLSLVGPQDRKVAGASTMQK